MSFILIAGVPGAGKSTVCKELKLRGYKAYEGDDKHSHFFDDNTGKQVTKPKSMSAKVYKEWYKHDTWKMSVDELQKLKVQAVESDIFICGNASNKEEYIPLFDKVFALNLDLDTLKKRIKYRPSKAFGHNPYEIEILEKSYAESLSYYENIEAIIIDSSRPIKEVVDSIIAKLKD